MLTHSLFLIAFALFPYSVLSYNYLVVNPIFGYSHAKFMGKLSDVIAEGGHNVTVLQYYHTAFKNSDKLIKNQKVEILNYFPHDYDEMVLHDKKTFPEFWDSAMMTNAFLGSIMVPSILSKEFEREGKRVLTDKELHKQLIDKKFDAVLVETFESVGFYLAHIINVPVITSFSAVRHPSQSLFGQPSTLGYVPAPGSRLPPNAGLWDRLNDYYNHYFYHKMFDGLMNKQHEMFVSVMEGDVPSWQELVTKSPIFVTNANPYLDFAMPSAGNIVQIGGITTPKPKKLEPLPEEYESILKERDSTVLISFGSVVRSYQMPEKFKSGVIQMLKNLPDVTFIWKYEIDDEEFQKKLPKNVHLKKWVPQPALLADDRLKVFMTHGGLGSTMEVAYSGKPALMVPLFGDQPLNAQMLARHGGAVAYDKYELPDGEKLSRTMREMVTDSKYKKNAEELRKVLRNQPIEPKETFLKHIEFAVKFPKFKSQIPEITQTGLIGFYYLDVLTVLSLVAVLLTYLTIKLFIRILGKFVNIQSKKPKNE